jgi:hypothetical protein
MKYIQALQHLNHIYFKIKSNLVAYKPIDAPKGMCQSKHYLFVRQRGMCPSGIETI